MKNFMANPDTVERRWCVVNAGRTTLGRLTSEVVAVLGGKNGPIFTPHASCGDYIIVINAGKTVVTGKRLGQKVYYSHSLYVGGMEETTPRELKAKKPGKVIENAVKGMLPKGPLGARIYKRLHVHARKNHSHRAQKPEILTTKG